MFMIGFSAFPHSFMSTLDRGSVCVYAGILGFSYVIYTYFINDVYLYYVFFLLLGTGALSRARQTILDRFTMGAASLQQRGGGYGAGWQLDRHRAIVRLSMCSQ